MGYSKLLFTALSIDEEFLCDECGNVLTSPIMLNPCEHAFCKSCIGHVGVVKVVGSIAPGSNPAAPPTSSQCPFSGCQKQITGTAPPQKRFTSLLNKQELKCLFVDDGCKWKGTLGKLSGHLKNVCKYNNWKRCDKGCRAKIMKVDEGDHNCLEFMIEKYKMTRKKLKRVRGKLRHHDSDASSESSGTSEDEVNDDGPSSPKRSRGPSNGGGAEQEAEGNGE